MTSLITAVPAVAALWAATAAQTYSLAARRGRSAVRRTALRARATLLAGATAGLVVAFVAAPPVAMPLLALPAAAALWRTLPRLGALAGALRTDPWGPSDPATRRAAGDPVLTVPPLAGLAGVLAVPVALGGWVAVVVAYGLAGAVTAAFAVRAPYRRETVTRAGVLRRVLVRAAAPAQVPVAAGPEAA
jgi:hypothetical protein